MRKGKYDRSTLKAYYIRYIDPSCHNFENCLPPWFVSQSCCGRPLAACRADGALGDNTWKVTFFKISPQWFNVYIYVMWLKDASDAKVETRKGFNFVVNLQNPNWTAAKSLSYCNESDFWTIQSVFSKRHSPKRKNPIYAFKKNLLGKKVDLLPYYL